jgi:hypothetical protein
LARAPLKRSLAAVPVILRNAVTSVTLHRAGILFLAAAALGACRTEHQVAVRVSIPDADSRETPAAGVGVVALPYDRDSILATLEARARTPRPRTTELDSLFAQFRGPFTRYTTVSYRAGQLRDALDSLRQSPDSGTHSAPVRRVADSLRSLEQQVNRARVELDHARAVFVRRSEPLRAAIRQWQDSTYRGWDSIVENVTRASGREPATDTTDQTGWAHFTLAPGNWWLYANAWDTGDPNSAWYWNVPVKEDTVLLSSRTGQRKPRY